MKRYCMTLSAFNLLKLKLECPFVLLFGTPGERFAGYVNRINLSFLASLISTVQHLPGIYFERTLPMKEDDYDYDGWLSLCSSSLSHSGWLWCKAQNSLVRNSAGCWLLNRTDQQSIMYAVTTTAAAANQKEWVKQLLHPVEKQNEAETPWF